MKGFRTFFDELLHADSITEVLSEHRKETALLLLLMAVFSMGVLLYMHKGSEELLISDAGGAGDQTGSEVSETGETDPSGEVSGEAGTGGIDPDAYGEEVIYVDIDGEVKNPMLAQLPAGSRVDDAIKAAGGVTKDADLTGVNRAQILTDGEKLIIPKEGEAGGAILFGDESPSGPGGGQSGGLVNINTADLTTLQTLTGVGPVTAQKIIDYREQNGRFQSIEDLKKISGIGDKTFEKMRNDVTI